jgi:hypothetical protein
MTQAMVAETGATTIVGIGAWRKLRDGSWGVRVTSPFPPASGAGVLVAKKDGTSKIETVDRVLWSGDGAHLCTVVAKPKRGACACEGECCARGGGCKCEAHCVCKGGPIHDC